MAPNHSNWGEEPVPGRAGPAARDPRCLNALLGMLFLGVLPSCSGRSVFLPALCGMGAAALAILGPGYPPDFGVSLPALPWPRFSLTPRGGAGQRQWAAFIHHRRVEKHTKMFSPFQYCVSNVPIGK